MKKLNLVCAAVAVLAAAGAQAGTATATPNTIAIENYGPTSTAAATVGAAAITYSMSNITAVNGGSTVYFTVRLSGAKFAGTAPTPTAGVGAFKFGGTTCSTATAPVNCVLTLSADRSTIKVAVTPAATTTLGLGAFSYTPGTTDIDSVNTTLNTVGNKVSASIGLTTLDPASIQATAVQGNVDGSLGTGDLAVAARALTPTANAPTSSVRIDLTASPAGSGYRILNGAVSATAPLGQFKWKADGTTTLLDGTTPFATPTATGYNVVVTPGAGQSFPIGAVLNVYADGTCAALATGAGAGTGQTITATNASSPVTITIPAGAGVIADDTYRAVCMTAPSSSPTQNLATPIQPTIAATLTPAVSTQAIGVATGTGYNLQYNGSSVTVNTYWPAGLAAFNFTGYLRVTNTGSVPAAVSLAHLSAANGAPGTSSVIIPSLAAGQTVLLTSTAVEALAGAAGTPTQASRVRVTAPTDGLRVQSMLQFNNGNLVEFANN